MHLSNSIQPVQDFTMCERCHHRPQPIYPTGMQPPLCFLSDRTANIRNPTLPPTFSCVPMMSQGRPHWQQMCSVCVCTWMRVPVGRLVPKTHFISSTKCSTHPSPINTPAELHLLVSPETHQGGFLFSFCFTTGFVVL